MPVARQDKDRAAALGFETTSEANPMPPRPARLLVTVLAGVPWLMVGVQWLMILPRFDRLFHNYGLPLPTFPRAVLDLARWLGDNVLLAGWAFLVCVILSLFRVWKVMGQDMSARQRNWRLLAVFAVPLVLFLLAWVGVAGPYSKLREALTR